MKQLLFSFNFNCDFKLFESISNKQLMAKQRAIFCPKCHIMRRLSFLSVLLLGLNMLHGQAWKSFNILSGNPNATGNELRFLNGTTGCLGTTIAVTNGVPAGNNNLPYGVAFDPTEGKLYYGKAGTTAGTTVFNVYNNTGVTATNTNLTTITGGEYFRMEVGQDGNVYGTVTALVIQLSASAPRIDILTVKLTRYNPSTNTFTILGNIQCPAAYASTMPAPYNDGNYWSSSDATTTPFYAAQLGNAGYGDIAISPDNTMYMSIGKKLIGIPNYQSITGTALIPSVEIGNILPTGVGFNFTTQGPGTYGISWDYTNNNLLVISSRSSDGSDGSYNVSPSTGALVGAFRVNCLATPTSANFGDLSSVLSSIGVANRITSVQYLGHNNRYRINYRIRIENIGTSTLKNVQSSLNLSAIFPSLSISNVSASFVSNPASLQLNPSYTGTGTNGLLNGIRTLYAPIYNGINLNGGGGNVTAGSNFSVIDVVFDVAGVATNGVTNYNATATGTGTAFDATTITDNSDNGATVESGTPNNKADDAGEGDVSPIKFGSSISGTVWNDANNSANGTFSNIFTAGESGTNAGGLNAILIDPITNLVIASVPVATNGTYSFVNIPSFANLQVILSTESGTVGSPPPVASLPPNWAPTSPISTNTTGDVNTGTYNGNDGVRFGATDDANNDFGISAATTTISGFNPTSGCAGATSVTITGTNFTGATAVSIGGTSVSSFTVNSATQITATVGSGTTGTISVVTPGGTATSVGAFTVNPLPTVSVTQSGATNYCTPGGTAVTLTASGVLNYSWSPAAGLSATNTAMVNATPASTTTYTVVGSDANGCVGSNTSSVSVVPNVSISAITATPASVCEGGNSTLEVLVGVPSAYCTSSYSVGTTYGDWCSLVEIVGTTLNNSTGPSASIPYYTLYPATGNTTATLTAGASYTIVFRAGTYSANDFAAWIDYNNNGILSDPGEKLGQLDNIASSPTTDSFNFTVPLTALNGPLRLRVREADYNGLIDPCGSIDYGETEDYTVTVIGGVTPILSYSWTPATFLSSQTSAIVSAVNVTSSETYSVLVSDGNGCSATSNVGFTLLNRPTAVVSGGGAVCAGATLPDVSIALTGTGPWYLTYTDGTTPASVTGTSTNPYVISGAAAGNYTVTSLSDANCAATAGGMTGSASVSINPYAPQPTLVSPVTSPVTICSGTSTTLEAAALADHTIEWRWFTGAFGGPMATSTSNPLTTPALASTRTYYAFQQNTLTGCWSEIGTVARLNISSIPSALAGADRLVCPGTNTFVGPATAVSGWSYSWSPATLLSSTTANRPTVQAVPVDYNQDYTLTVTNALGCTATDIVNVSARSITNLLAATNAGQDVAVCAGQPALLGSGSAPATGFTYTWTPFAALNNRFSSMPAHLFNNTSSTVANVTTYTLTVRETATGCRTTDEVVVTTNPLPASNRVNAGADQTIVQGASTVIGGALPVAGLSYSWSPATGLSSATVAKPTANPTSTTTYTITVSNSFGCSRSDDMTLTVNPVRTGVFGDKVEVVVYPNPVKDALHLSSNLPMDGNLSIVMLNELGQTVLGRELGLSGNTLNEEIDIRNLAQGVYTVIVRSAEGESSFKIVKE